MVATDHSCDSICPNFGVLLNTNVLFGVLESPDHSEQLKIIYNMVISAWYLMTFPHYLL